MAEEKALREQIADLLQTPSPPMVRAAGDLLAQKLEKLERKIKELDNRTKGFIKYG